MKNLQTRYNAICAEYIVKFCDKQGLDFDFWRHDIPGTVAAFGDIYLGFDDIRIDIDSNQPSGRILEWWLKVLDNNLDCSYYSYITVLKNENNG